MKVSEGKQAHRLREKVRLAQGQRHRKSMLRCALPRSSLCAGLGLRLASSATGSARLSAPCPAKESLVHAGPFWSELTKANKLRNIGVILRKGERYSPGGERTI